MEQSPPIAYSCYYTRNREGEQFVPQHVFSYQIAGTLTINDGHSEYIFNEGDFRFIKRNQLLKFNKQPPPEGAFKSVSIYFDQDTLIHFSSEFGYRADNATESHSLSDTQPITPVVQLKNEYLFKTFMDSLIPYIEPSRLINRQLQIIKQREALILLLQSDPELKNILFDFNEPGKIDLEEFMQKNFHFNVHLSRFAYLTGRSLATFKRDFNHIFRVPPGKWLQQRRLQEAHYLIQEKGRAPSDFYLEIGFEDLSHFSFAFKKMYGQSPSKLAG